MEEIGEIDGLAGNLSIDSVMGFDEDPHTSVELFR
jgi:hypothetical protein